MPPSTRDIEAALATMARPMAVKGGFARCHSEVRAYWTEQWSAIDPHVQPAPFHTDTAGRIVVDVHKFVRNLNGAAVADGHLVTTSRSSPAGSVR